MATEARIDTRLLPFFRRNDRMRVGAGLRTATSARGDMIIADRRPAASLKLGFTRLSFNLLHRSKDSTHLDFGFEFDRHPVSIIGEPDQKRPTALKQSSKD